MKTKDVKIGCEYLSKFGTVVVISKHAPGVWKVLSKSGGTHYLKSKDLDPPF